MSCSDVWDGDGDEPTEEHRMVVWTGLRQCLDECFVVTRRSGDVQLKTAPDASVPRTVCPTPAR